MKNDKTRLPQYFFGDDMNRGGKLAKNDSILLGTTSIVEDFHASEPNLSRIPSPASSLASTKKLEWDSGADIGYNVYNSFKNSRRSKSFPTLNMDLSISQINKSDETQGDEISMENKVTDDDKEILNVNYQCSSQFKPQSKRKNNFKHSTPNEEKMVSKSTNKNKDECLQTTLINICSRSVQTDDNIITNDQKVNRSQQTDTIKSQSSSSGSSLSKSSSFQYIPGSNKSKSTTESSDTPKSASSHQTESRESKSARSETSKNHSDTSSSTKNHSEESNTSNSSPLGKMIATQQSKHLITDIDKSLHILQKFISSKNYTPDTKKYYARKIVNKIITSKYTGDSSSSNSTLSIGKSGENSKSEKVSCGVPCDPVQKNASTETSKNNTLSIEKSIKLKINGSKDVNDFINKENKKLEKVSCGVQCDPVQKNASTETSKNKRISEKLEEIISKNNKFTEETKHKNKSDLHLEKNWRQAETLSEKLFEARKKSVQSSHTSVNTSEEIKNIDKPKNSDYLIQHSKNERKRQLSWINNEISYLHRLKELLSKNDSSSNASTASKSSYKSIKFQNNSVTDKTIPSSMSDIEIKFYQEFGSDDSSKITDNVENLKKLSKYLTNDQIKFLIDNEAKNLHCQTCECCKQTKLDTSKTIEKKSGGGDQNSLKGFTSHDIRNSSFNSHSYKFYENVIRSPKQNSPKDNHLVSKKSDAGIQCTLKKKKHHPQNPIEKKSSTSTVFSPDSLNDKKNVEVFYKNVSNFDHTDSQSTHYGRIDSEILPQYKLPPKTGKENYLQRKPIKYRNKQTKPIAYFLTFEEESMYEYAQKRLQIQKPLENVTVKVPKLPKKIRNSEGNVKNLTLKDYLMKNRPEFVRSADWRRSIVADQTQKKVRNIFTCAQMKELTSKKYCRLPEVRSKIHNCKITDQKRQNRCMAKVFSKKLQKQTLKGHMSIATCINVMSSE